MLCRPSSKPRPPFCRRAACRWQASGYPLEDFNLTIPKGALGTYFGTGPIPSQNEHISSNPYFTGIIVGSVTPPLTELYSAHPVVKSVRVDQKVDQGGLENFDLLLRTTFYTDSLFCVKYFGGEGLDFQGMRVYPSDVCRGRAGISRPALGSSSG